MRNIVVIYSPICEATGSFIETLRGWLRDTDINIIVYPFHNAPNEYMNLMSSAENCFIDVFYNGTRIDWVPLHKEKLFTALGIEIDNKQRNLKNMCGISNDKNFTESEIREQLFQGNIDFIPITKDTYMDELSMCLCHYPMGNPPKLYHNKCIAIKEAVYRDVWQFENVAGIYAKMNGNVAGLLEVFPRKVMKKYGYMAGIDRDDDKVLSVGCYEVAFGIPRTFMLDELMFHLLQIKNLFLGTYLEGIGIPGWNDGFNPYWVYDKYGFTQVAKIAKNMFVMEKTL